MSMNIELFKKCFNTQAGVTLRTLEETCCLRNAYRNSCENLSAQDPEETFGYSDEQIQRAANINANPRSQNFAFGLVKLTNRAALGTYLLNEAIDNRLESDRAELNGRLKELTDCVHE